MRSFVCMVFAVVLAACGETTDIIGTRAVEATVPDPDAGSDLDAGPDVDVGPEVPDDILGGVGVPQPDADSKIRSAYEQLFFGDADTEAIYFEPDDDSGYIEDIKDGDVRTDAIGYGMLVTVQLDEREVFDKLWTWAKRHMLHTTAPREGLLSWRCQTDGTGCDDTAVADATSVIATALFMAQARWGDGGGHPYEADANMLIDAMVLTVERNGAVVDNVGNLFDRDTKLPRRYSQGADTPYLPTDYLMPAFYDYWAKWRSSDASFWTEASLASRQLLRRAPMDDNGLIPFEIDGNGEPKPDTRYDEVAARTLANRWFLQAWRGPYAWIPEQNAMLLDFLLAQDPLVSAYELDGARYGDRNTGAHIALTAMAAAYSGDIEKYSSFVKALADAPIPTGMGRYFDGVFYLISLLALSGNLHEYGP